MKASGFKTTVIGLAANIFLFVLKLVVGLMSNSLALLSDAFNSFTDIFASFAVFVAVKASSEKPDPEHPFGHRRAEPIAGLIIAILTGILGFEVLRTAVFKLFEVQTLKLAFIAVIALTISILVKGILWIYFKRIGKKINSPAILATSTDARNDVLVSGIAVIGVIGSFLGYSNLDSAAAIIISLFIMWSGYKIGKENIDYLVGRAPPKEVIEEIKKRALSVKGVLGVHDIKAHYVGNYIHVEVHIGLDKEMSTEKAHEIGKKVENKIQGMPNTDDAFIHIDPA